MAHAARPNRLHPVLRGGLDNGATHSIPFVDAYYHSTTSTSFAVGPRPRSIILNLRIVPQQILS